MGGDGGGDSGYEAKQAQIEATKKLAREQLNHQFGIGDAATIDRTRYMTKGMPGTAAGWFEQGNSGDRSPTMGLGIETPGTPDAFDQTGFDAEVAGINGTKNAREKLYQTVRDNTFNAGKRGLDEQRDDAGRKLKFELFARGLNGGSEDINQNALLGRTYQQGLLDLGGKADAAKADFRGNDESTRLGLLQSIDAGMDQGSAMSSAIQQMQVNGDRAAAAAQGTTLGDLFANTGLIYNRSQAAQGRQAGTEWYNDYSRNGTTGSKAYSPRITGTQ